MSAVYLHTCAVVAHPLNGRYIRSSRCTHRGGLVGGRASGGEGVGCKSCNAPDRRNSRFGFTKITRSCRSGRVARLELLYRENYSCVISSSRLLSGGGGGGVHCAIIKLFSIGLNYSTRASTGSVFLDSGVFSRCYFMSMATIVNTTVNLYCVCIKTLFTTTAIADY